MRQRRWCAIRSAGEGGLARAAARRDAASGGAVDGVADGAFSGPDADDCGGAAAAATVRGAADDAAITGAVAGEGAAPGNAVAAGAGSAGSSASGSSPCARSEPRPGRWVASSGRLVAPGEPRRPEHGRARERRRREAGGPPESCARAGARVPGAPASCGRRRSSRHASPRARTPAARRWRAAPTASRRPAGATSGSAIRVTGVGAARAAALASIAEGPAALQRIGAGRAGRAARPRCAISSACGRVGGSCAVVDLDQAAHERACAGVARPRSRRGRRRRSRSGR